VNFINKNAIKKGVIITKDLEKNKKVKGAETKFIPLWKWLLET